MRMHQPCIQIRIAIYLQYEDDGLRTKRTNGSKTYNYVYTGGKLTQMTVGKDTLYFAYNGDTPFSVTWNGTLYYYVIDGQGNVSMIVDANGEHVCGYLYDAWGNILHPTDNEIENLNPIRYRGYVFDQETGLYYLQSRYYNPEMGRFISPDAFAATGQGFIGANMFAYCNNNPVMFSDADGMKPDLEALSRESRLVGATVQFEVDIGGLAVGVELVIYWDPIVLYNDHCNDEYEIVHYFYMGGTVDLDKIPTADIASILMNNKALLNQGTSDAMIDVLTGFLDDKGLELSGSVAVGGIWGFDNFDRAKSYAGGFETLTVSGIPTKIPGVKAKAFLATSPTCFVVGAGISFTKSPFISISYSYTEYFMM